MTQAYRLVYIGIIGALCVLRPAFGDPDSLTADFSFQFLEEPIHPRLTAMGGAGTALPGGSFAYYNPALPALLDQPYLALEYGQYPAGDLVTPLVEGTWKNEKWFTGLSFQSYTVSEIGLSDERGVNPHLSASWQESMLFLSVGLIKDQFALAIQAEGMQARIQGRNAYGLAASGGITYTMIPGKLHFGAAGFHAGKTTSFLGTDSKLGDGTRLPASARIGGAWADTIGSVGYKAAVDIVYRHVNKQILLPVGVEIQPVEPLAIRIGKRLNHDTELFSCGLGLSASPLNFDIGFTIPKLISDVELKWRFRISYLLGEKKSAKAPTDVSAPPKPESQPDIVNDQPVIEEQILEEPVEIEEFGQEEEAEDESAPVPSPSRIDSTQVNVEESGPEETPAIPAESTPSTTSEEPPMVDSLSGTTNAEHSED